MKPHSIRVNGTWEDHIGAVSPLVAAVKYIEENIPPEEHRQIKGYAFSDMAEIRTPNYRIEARPVPELVGV